MMLPKYVPDYSIPIMETFINVFYESTTEDGIESVFIKNLVLRTVSDESISTIRSSVKYIILASIYCSTHNDLDYESMVDFMYRDITVDELHQHDIFKNSREINDLLTTVIIVLDEKQLIKNRYKFETTYNIYVHLLLLLDEIFKIGVDKDVWTI